MVTLQTGIQAVPSWNHSWDSSCADFSSVTPVRYQNYVSV